jgi:hypothetical protein
MPQALFKPKERAKQATGKTGDGSGKMRATKRKNGEELVGSDEDFENRKGLAVNGNGNGNGKGGDAVLGLKKADVTVKKDVKPKSSRGARKAGVAKPIPKKRKTVEETTEDEDEEEEDGDAARNKKKQVQVQVASGETSKKQQKQVEKERELEEAERKAKEEAEEREQQKEIEKVQREKAILSQQQQKQQYQQAIQNKKLQSQLVLRKCKCCFQRVDVAELNTWDIEENEGDGEAKDEGIALLDPRLQLQLDGDDGFFDYEEKPSYRLTNFAIFDALGHMCTVDCGIIESGGDLFFAGHVKSIWDEDPDHRNAVPIHKSMRPIED